MRERDSGKSDYHGVRCDWSLTQRKTNDDDDDLTSFFLLVRAFLVVGATAVRVVCWLEFRSGSSRRKESGWLMMTMTMMGWDVGVCWGGFGVE